MNGSANVGGDFSAFLSTEMTTTILDRRNIDEDAANCNMVLFNSF